MSQPDCVNCKHDKPFDEWLNEVRMCAALEARKSRDLMRSYGECGPEGKLFEARA